MASLDAPTSPDGGCLGDLLGEDDQRLDHVVDVTALQPLLAALPERDLHMLQLRFGAEQTQAQIAEQIGVSQMHVSRLLTGVLARLREQLLA